MKALVLCVLLAISTTASLADDPTNSTRTADFLLIEDNSAEHVHYKNHLLNPLGSTLEDQLLSDAKCISLGGSEKFYFSQANGVCEKYGPLTFRRIKNRRTKRRGEGIDARDMARFVEGGRPLLIPGQSFGGLDEICEKLRGRKAYYDPTFRFCRIRNEILPITFGNKDMLQATAASLRKELGFECTKSQRITDQSCELYRYPFGTNPRKVMLLLGLEEIINGKLTKVRVKEDTKIKKLWSKHARSQKNRSAGLLARATSRA